MERNLTMMTDLYQLTMMYGYFRKGMGENRAVFDLFYRRAGEEISHARGGRAWSRRWSI